MCDCGRLRWQMCKHLGRGHWQDHERACVQAHMFQILLKKPQQSGSAGLAGVSFVITEAAPAATPAGAAPQSLHCCGKEGRGREGVGVRRGAVSIPVPIPMTMSEAPLCFQPSSSSSSSTPCPLSREANPAPEAKHHGGGGVGWGACPSGREGSELEARGS